MKLNQTIAYAIAAVTKLSAAQPGELLSCNDLCSDSPLPVRYVMQLMRKLTVAGVVISVRGRDGGYKLAKPAAKTTLLEIVEAVDGPIGQNERVDMPPMPRNALAAVEGAFTAIEADARKRLRTVTLASLRFAEAA